jgi:hypothetical protein
VRDVGGDIDVYLTRGCDGDGVDRAGGCIAGGADLDGVAGEVALPVGRRASDGRPAPIQGTDLPSVCGQAEL